MARPLKKDEDLLHPRRIRKSQTVSQQLDIKPPTKREKARYAPLVAACVAACLRTDRADNLAKKERVAIYYSDYSKRPKWMPTGLKSDIVGKSCVVSYSCDLLLRTLYEQKIADYSPHDLYRAKSGLLTDLEKSIDSVLELDL